MTGRTALAGLMRPAAGDRRFQPNLTRTDLALLIRTSHVATLEAWPATGACTAEQPPLIVTVAFGAPVAVTVT